MDPINRLQTQIDALTQQSAQWQHQTRTLARQLRWWRGLACGLIGVALLTWSLPSGTAQNAHQKRGLEERVAALESLLQHFSRQGHEVTITGANLHLVNGLGSTDCTDEFGDPIPDCPNGVGNLIVGYNELRDEPPQENIRTGSHTVVVGQFNNFSSIGGLVVGAVNEIRGNFTVVSGGNRNIASGHLAVVSGGTENTASGHLAVVSGGRFNTASGDYSSVSGGRDVVQEADEGWAAGSFGGEVAGSFRSP